MSVREGAIYSSTLLKRLRSGSHKNSTYTAFREVGRVTRTVRLLRCLSDAPLHRRVTAATNKVESFNRFSQWVGLGNQGVLAEHERHRHALGELDVLGHVRSPESSTRPIVNDWLMLVQRWTAAQRAWLAAAAGACRP
ncbi:Tn3 family transposase [Streptomyces sp. NBC_00582]|uniref:Tn3 family transposase n=1 Tax=Streptomyces sp. NBC_00582 TaxID=2975783 RepID=UPI002E8049BE|nr:Tn3 family transposase [Streptomyces sp. NBC_00582]WUB67182.1 transposase [Streptomyces sp. NBC_00582]